MSAYNVNISLDEEEEKILKHLLNKYNCTEETLLAAMVQTELIQEKRAELEKQEIMRKID